MALSTAKKRFEQEKEQPDQDQFSLMVNMMIHEKERFTECIKKDRSKIPISIRLFLGHEIRNALAVLNAQSVKRILEALNTVGL